MEDKIKILKSVKHDIKAPIKTIIGLASIIKSKTNNERIITYSKDIIKSCNILETLVEDIINMYAYDEENIEVKEEIFSIANLIKNLCTIARFQSLSKKQIFNSEVNLKANELFIGDEKLITKVLLNIINNAIKYTPEGGKISFESFINTLDQNYSTADFVIQDNGYGIETNYIEDIFKPFSREKSIENVSIEGSGIGLAISKSIIDILNGSIEVESEKGKGSKFIVKFILKNAKNEEMSKISSIIILSDYETINHVKNSYINENVNITEESDIFSLLENLSKNSYDVILLDIKNIKEHTKHFLDLIKIESKNSYIILLVDEQNQIRYEYTALDGIIKKPFFHSKIDEIISKREILDNSLNGFNFLVAEDNYFNQEIIKEILSSKGGNVKIVNDGKECIETLKENNKFDAILLDINMPYFNGIETLKIIKDNNLTNNIPIIAITSSDEIDYKEYGFQYTLHKNFNSNEIYEILKKYKCYI